MSSGPHGRGKIAIRQPQGGFAANCNDRKAPYLKKGHFSYSSSGMTYAGRTVTRDVTLRNHGGETPVVTLQNQPVFAVDRERQGSNPSCCTDGPCNYSEEDPQPTVAMMGVAFDRPERIPGTSGEGTSSGGAGQSETAASVDPANPFLNAGGNAGYMIIDGCVVLGFDSMSPPNGIDLGKFVQFKLSKKGAAVPGSYAEPQVRVSLKSSDDSPYTFPGPVKLLVDTGINYGIFSVSTSSPPCCYTPSAKRVDYLETTYTVTVAQGENAPFLSFSPVNQTGAGGSDGARIGVPAFVRWSLNHTLEETALNTGRYVLRGHAFYFDAAHGTYGFGPAPANVCGQ